MTTATTQTGKSYASAPYRMYVLIALTLVYTLNFVDRALLNVIGQPVIAEFHLSDFEFGFLNGPPFAIFYALMGIPIAMAADRYNRVAILALAVAMWSLMAALCGFATSFLFLLFARIGVAVGEAGGTPASNSIIGDYFEPKRRAAALGFYAMGVTIGVALSNFFAGPILRNFTGPKLQALFHEWGWSTMHSMFDWQHVAGWRVAFVVIGAPGVIIALIVMLTVREPPRGYSDPPGTVKPKPPSMWETFKELGGKPSFWTMSLAASLMALVGYGLNSFQSPMTQRLHGIDAGTFALRIGGLMALVAAAGTFTGGIIVDRISHRLSAAVALVPAVGAFLAVPLYLFTYYRPTDELFGLMRVTWFAAAFFHYMYLGSQYTIAQGVVSQRSRAAAVAIMLLCVGLLGNGVGPPLVGWLSDTFMNMGLRDAGFGGILTGDLCRNAAAVAQLPLDQQAVCRTAYGEGLRSSMVTAVLILIPAGISFYLSSLTLKKDMVAKLH